MYRVKFLSGVIGATLWAFGAAAVELPTGPNSAFVARTCSSCHDLDMVVDAAGLNREGWSGTIDEMVSYGLKVTPDEKNQLLEYFTAFLGPDAKKK